MSITASEVHDRVNNERGVLLDIVNTLNRLCQMQTLRINALTQAGAPPSSIVGAEARREIPKARRPEGIGA